MQRGGWGRKKKILMWASPLNKYSKWIPDLVGKKDVWACAVMSFSNLHVSVLIMCITCTMYLCSSERTIKELKERLLKAKGTPNLQKIEDINVVCGCLKQFFIALREPLITNRLNPIFMQAIGKLKTVFYLWKTFVCQKCIINCTHIFSLSLSLSLSLSVSVSLSLSLCLPFSLRWKKWSTGVGCVVWNHCSTSPL